MTLAAAWPDGMPVVRDNIDLTGLFSLFALTLWSAVLAIASIVFGVMALWLRRRHVERAFLATDFVPQTLTSLICFASVAGSALVGLWLLPETTRAFLDENVWLVFLAPAPFWWFGYAFFRGRGRRA